MLASRTLGKPEVKPFVHKLVQTLQRIDLRVLGSVLGGLLLLGFGVWLFFRLRRPTPDEIERRRRVQLSEKGRITDGFILDTRTLDGEESISDEPEVLVYSYRLAGVVYNCAQDVSTLADRVRGFRLDQPVQVRYDPRNPGNSVLVSEVWSGLRTLQGSRTAE
jgi:hypothetical protein